MKTLVRISLPVFAVIALNTNSAPVLAQTHVSEQTVNLGDTSFLDGIAGPGGVAEEIADGGHYGKVVGSKGEQVPGSGSVNSISGLTHIAWLSHSKIAGGWYGAELVGVAAYVHAGTQGRVGGLGDLTVGPLILQWPQQHLLRMPIDQRFVADFDLPVGRYARDSGVNLGSNAYTVHPYYAITAHPTKRVETSWRVSYLWSAKNSAPPLSTGYQSTQAGQVIHFNATAAYNVYKSLWVGPNGYVLAQITDGKINGVAVSNSPERVAALGPGAVWTRQHWLFFINQYTEFGARNRATGQKLVLRVEKVF